MRRLTQSKSINIFLTAILILNQAVFLFIPVLAGQAQTSTDNTYYTAPSTTTTYTTPTIDTTTYIAPTSDTTTDTSTTNTTTYTPVELTAKITSPASGATVSGKINIQVKPSLSDAKASLNISNRAGTVIKKDLPMFWQNGLLSATWDTTTVADGSYIIDSNSYVTRNDTAGQETFTYDYDQIFVDVKNNLNAANPAVNTTPSASDSNIIFQDIITDTTDTSTHYILTLEFLSPPMRLSGQPNFSVRTSEAAEVVFYIYKDGAEIKKSNAISKGNNTYSFIWDTASVSNGQYTIKASAKKSGYIDALKQIDVTVENSTLKTPNNLTNPTPATPITPTAPVDLSTKPADSTTSYEITFMEAFQPPLTGEKRVTASLNKDVDGVDFSIEGPKSYKYNGIRDNNRQYYFMWNTPSFPNGYYKITANARLAGTIKTSRSFSIQIINNGTSPNNLLPPTQPMNPEIMEKQPQPMVPQVQPELLPECKKNNITSIEECQRFMNIPPDCRERGLLSQEECQKFKAIPPECRDKGLLSQ
ncbi:MAG: hypothetical protein PHP21_03255, partial [Patescibacteria group bacterium]|nr:hypothetical protein [Patescibacteria group bacterium]